MRSFQMNEPVLIAPEGRLHEEGGLAAKRIRAPVLPSAEATVREGILEIPGELALHHGGRLTGVRLAWRLVGPASAPVICALGGIPASRHACAGDRERPGWWSELAGPDRPLDSHRYRLLSFDYLGGSGETTGPRSAEPFPSIST